MIEAVPISALEHFMYCERQAALIWVDGVWQDNSHTKRGSRAHRRVDSGRHSSGRGVRTMRAIRVWSETLGLTGVADAVEIHADGTLLPVEYKSGVRHGRSAEVQVAAQAACLEEMFQQRIPNVAVWYGGPRRRIVTPLDDDLRDLTTRVVRTVQALREKSSLPTAPDDERCTECQLLDRCLPSVVSRADDVNSYVDQVVTGCRS